jgi:hypothetical protein
VVNCWAVLLVGEFFQRDSSPPPEGKLHRPGYGLTTTRAFMEEAKLSPALMTPRDFLNELENPK